MNDSKGEVHIQEELYSAEEIDPRKGNLNVSSGMERTEEITNLVIQSLATEANNSKKNLKYGSINLQDEDGTVSKLLEAYEPRPG